MANHQTKCLANPKGKNTIIKHVWHTHNQNKKTGQATVPKSRADALKHVNWVGATTMTSRPELKQLIGQPWYRR